MSETRPTSQISLSALRPELFRLVPKLRETGEVLLLTHHRKVVAVLGPPCLLDLYLAEAEAHANSDQAAFDRFVEEQRQGVDGATS